MRPTDATQLRPAFYAGWCLVLAGSVASAVQGNHAAETLKAFHAAQTEYQARPHDVTAAWHFARAGFDLADLATNNTERAAIAEQGLEAGRHAVAAASNSAPAHYYLGLNMAQLARTKSLGALPLLDHMEHELLAASELDPAFDYGGADRSVGLLYRDAPSFGSVGSRSKARQHLQRAVQIAPNFPENRLNLIESLLRWGDRNTALRELKQLEASWDGAHGTFTGPAWADSWPNWELRFEKVKRKLEPETKTSEPPGH